MPRQHLLGHDGLMFLGGDFDCTSVPHPDRSFVSPPGRHDSLALKRLLGRAQLCNILEFDMERAEKERTISTFHAAAHSSLTLCPASMRQNQ
ncbi:hypothetical protein CCR75_009501 [Bremia lactucae]|uniref:Uncharacterized protein n=1 Tax=Bremia lactucae TaxID=4779 RepID=A0A976IES3_BRELC|nr:hypothetical protein CCR75_009501 [Bremia lactucae]